MTSPVAALALATVGELALSASSTDTKATSGIARCAFLTRYNQKRKLATFDLQSSLRTELQVRLP